jgi:hypothetical protein
LTVRPNKDTPRVRPTHTSKTATVAVLNAGDEGPFPVSSSHKEQHPPLQRK